MVFHARLDDFIRERVRLEGDGDHYEKWNYNEDYSRIRRLLLLFNVESVRRNGERSQWFPFDKFKFGEDGENSWSLEHIRPVQSQERGRSADWKEWLELHLELVKKIRGAEDSLVVEMKARSSTRNVTPWPISPCSNARQIPRSAIPFST